MKLSELVAVWSVMAVGAIALGTVVGMVRFPK